MAKCPYAIRSFDFKDPKKYFPGEPVTNYEKAHEFNLKSGVVSKCTFCRDRIDDPDERNITACAQACPTGARIFGDLNSHEMQQTIITRGGYQEQPERGTNPSVYYLPRRS